MNKLSDEEIIEIKNLSFKYGKHEKFVLHNFNLSVKKGELFGVFGINGSGKSTLLYILSTLYRRFEGDVKVCGLDLKKDFSLIKKKIGVLFQEARFDLDLTGEQVLEFYADIYGIKNKQKHIDYLLNFFDLKDFRNKKVYSFSAGMKKRLGLARCLLITPELLLLDEPTSGLDVAARNKFLNYLVKLNHQHKTTVIFVTHYFEEARAICDRIGVIANNKMAVHLNKKIIAHNAVQLNELLDYKRIIRK